MLSKKIHSIFKNSVGSKFSIEFIREELKEKIKKITNVNGKFLPDDRRNSLEELKHKLKHEYSEQEILNCLLDSGYKAVFCCTILKIVWFLPNEYYANFFIEKYTPYSKYISIAYNTGQSINQLDCFVKNRYRDDSFSFSEILEMIKIYEGNKNGC